MPCPQPKPFIILGKAIPKHDQISVKGCKLNDILTNDCINDHFWSTDKNEAESISTVQSDPSVWRKDGPSPSPSLQMLPARGESSSTITEPSWQGAVSNAVCGFSSGLPFCSLHLWARPPLPPPPLLGCSSSGVGMACCSSSSVRTALCFLASFPEVSTSVTLFLFPPDSTGKYPGMVSETAHKKMSLFVLH